MIDENPSIGLITLITSIPPIYLPTPADGRGSAWEEIFFTKTTSLARDQHIPFEINMEATSEAVDAVGDTLPSKKPQSLKLCSLPLTPSYQCHKYFQRWTSWLLSKFVRHFLLCICEKKITHGFAACCWLDRVERQILSKRMFSPSGHNLIERSPPDSVMKNAYTDHIFACHLFPKIGWLYIS